MRIEMQRWPDVLGEQGFERRRVRTGAPERCAILQLGDHERQADRRHLRRVRRGDDVGRGQRDGGGDALRRNRLSERDLLGRGELAARDLAVLGLDRDRDQAGFLLERDRLRRLQRAECV